MFYTNAPLYNIIAFDPVVFGGVGHCSTELASRPAVDNKILNQTQEEGEPSS